MPNIVVCKTCNDPASKMSPEETGLQILSALKATEMKDKFTVSYVDCMGACEEPTAIAFQGNRMATFLFSGVSVPGDIDDIVKTCRAYLNSSKGWIEDGLACGKLRHCLRARIPGL